jgi:hypothetical protein
VDATRNGDYYRVVKAYCDKTGEREFVEALAQALGRPLAKATPMSVSSLTVPRATSCGLDVTHTEGILSRRLPELSDVLTELIAEKEQPTCPTTA